MTAEKLEVSDGRYSAFSGANRWACLRSPLWGSLVGVDPGGGGKMVAKSEGVAPKNWPESASKSRTQTKVDATSTI